MPKLRFWRQKHCIGCCQGNEQKNSNTTFFYCLSPTSDFSKMVDFTTVQLIYHLSEYSISWAHNIVWRRSYLDWTSFRARVFITLDRIWKMGKIIIFYLCANLTLLLTYIPPEPWMDIFWKYQINKWFNICQVLWDLCLKWVLEEQYLTLNSIMCNRAFY